MGINRYLWRSAVLASAGSLAVAALTVTSLATSPPSARAATPYRVLFDASHGETAKAISPPAHMPPTRYGPCACSSRMAWT